MNNVLYEPLPQEWNGYPINTWFQIGVQIYLVSEDSELMDFEKTEIIAELLFPSECPPLDEMQACIGWFLNGWCHDKSPKEKDKRKLLDFNQDQWRIYADFRQIYGINLNESDLHWWEFMGMLWNMPFRQSSFLQVIDIRKKKINGKMGKDEKKAIMEAKQIYEIEQPEEKKEFTEDEKNSIDDYDRMMAEIRAKNKAEKELGLT